MFLRLLIHDLVPFLVFVGLIAGTWAHDRQNFVPFGLVYALILFVYQRVTRVEFTLSEEMREVGLVKADHRVVYGGAKLALGAALVAGVLVNAERKWVDVDRALEESGMRRPATTEHLGRGEAGARVGESAQEAQAIRSPDVREEPPKDPGPFEESGSDEGSAAAGKSGDAESTVSDRPGMDRGDATEPKSGAVADGVGVAGAQEATSRAVGQANLDEAREAPGAVSSANGTGPAPVEAVVSPAETGERKPRSPRIQNFRVDERKE